MVDDNDSNNKSDPSQKSLNRTLTEEERKQLIEKIKASLYLEDDESVHLYASLIKVSIP